MAFECGVSAESLTDVLSRYCVPKNADGCNTNVTATYQKTSNKCICNTPLYIWNKTNRVCEECSIGSFPYDNEKCQPIICKAGTYKVAINDACLPGTYKVLTSEIKCPSGSYKYNYSIN